MKPIFNNKGVQHSASRIVAVFAFLFLSAILAYCFLNDSGHGPNLQNYAFCFFPVFIFGIFMILTRQRIAGACLALISGIGIFFTFSADSMGIMMGYEEWIKADMPSPNPQRIPILSGIFCASLLFLATSLFTRTKENKQIHPAG